MSVSYLYQNAALTGEKCPCVVTKAGKSLCVTNAELYSVSIVSQNQSS